MALPHNLTGGLLPSEAEYLATSNVEINIVPLMRIDRVRLLDGVYGPLRPPAQASVPLWLALTLKKRKRCSIVCPDWMTLEALKAKLLEETMNDSFAKMPLHYVAISKSLLEFAQDDVRDSDEIRALLKSIREARQSKVLSGVNAVNTEHLAMENISLGEITELRAFLSTAFDHLLAMQRAGEPEQATTTVQTDRNTTQNVDGRQFTYQLAQSAQHESSTFTRLAAEDAQPYLDDDGSAHNESTHANQEHQGDESMNNMDLF